MVNLQTNVCENVCIWDGNTETWSPPFDYLMLVQTTTPSKIWSLVDGNYKLIETIGDGSVGFTWDGNFLTTNESQPQPFEPPADQPVTSGTQEL